MEEYLGILLRVSIMYLYALAVLRISGKRSIDHVSIFDFLVANIIGDMFDDVFWAEIPLAQGLTGMATIMLLHVLVSYLQERSDTVHWIVASKETVVVKNASFVKEGLERERTSKDTVYEQLRIKGEEKLEEVREANWEPGGKLSMLRKEAYREVQKQELQQLKELFK